MTTPTQQDLISHFTLRTEELRRVPGLRGPARLLHNLFLDLFLSIIRLLASLAERARARTLPDTAPAPQAGASPRIWPSNPCPSPSGWLEHRAPAATGGSTHAPCDQPKTPEPITEPPCQMPELELPAGLPQHANTGTSPPCRAARIFLATDARFSRLFSKKRAFSNGNYRDHFVAI